MPACRSCGRPLKHEFVDLGMSPLCESFLTAEQLDRMEPFYPLRVLVCDRCFLVQLREYVSPEEIFTEYAYFSSFSESWLRHARAYVEAMVPRFGLGPSSSVVELASNDGYLLQYFVERGVPVLGVEPAANVARAAIDRGVPTEVRLFGVETARNLRARNGAADLLLGNNVLAQVPDLSDFVGGMTILLAETGVLTLEFPHLVRLVEGNQFDTIYHEHFSYFSFSAVRTLLARHGLALFDVEELPSHGGSLRIYAHHVADTRHEESPAVAALLAREAEIGLGGLAWYDTFAAKVHDTKRALLSFLIDAKQQGKTIAGYGAPGKGNTLLNYCGIRTDFIDYTVDRNPYKHGRFLPGTHIPIHPPERIRETRPDYVLIIPWNLEKEIAAQLAFIREWGGRCVVPIPTVRVLP